MARGVTAADLAASLGVQLRGDGSLALADAASLEEAGRDQLSFCLDAKHHEALLATQAGGVLLSAETAEQLGEQLAGHTLLISARPDLDFARALKHFHPDPIRAPGIDARAVVAEGAQVDPSATIMALAYVGPGAKVGAKSLLHPQAHVGPDATLGEGCELHPHSVVERGCRLGDRVVLHAGAVIGADGFGYVLAKNAEGQPYHHKVPQVGVVVVEDDVEIGAGSCIDRATTGETRVGRGSKIDNQVQVGHNCHIGAASILCGQVGLAGSTTLGEGVVLAGGVGLAGHLHVGAGATIAAASGVMGNVEAGATLAGLPAQEHRSWLRVQAALRRLPEFVRRLRKVEKWIEAKASDGSVVSKTELNP